MSELQLHALQSVNDYGNQRVVSTIDSGEHIVISVFRKAGKGYVPSNELNISYLDLCNLYRTFYERKDQLEERWRKHE